MRATARIGDTARGLATLDGDWLGLHGVEVDNEPALALYEGLGFRRHHSCRYLMLAT